METTPLIGTRPQQRGVRGRAAFLGLLALAVVAMAAVALRTPGGPSALLAERRARATLDPHAADKMRRVRKGGSSMLTACEDSSGAAMNKTAIVAEHNAYRREVGAPDLEWDDSLAAIAQQWADNLKADPTNPCKMAHSTSAWRQEKNGGNSLGENIAWSRSSQGPPSKTGRQLTDLWTSEKAGYAYGPTGDMCTTPPRADGSTPVVGHYTQVVWAKTTKVGCGLAQCSSNGATVWVCEYDPPGNWMNQLPFREDGATHANLTKCPAAKITGATGAAPPANTPTGHCSAGGADCCSCGCGSGATTEGAEVPPPPPPPPPPSGTSAIGTPCSDYKSQNVCTASRCCDTGLSCMQYDNSFAMCLNPDVNWSMCIKSKKYPNGQGPWTCAVVNGTGPAVPWPPA